MDKSHLDIFLTLFLRSKSIVHMVKKYDTLYHTNIILFISLYLFFMNM